MKAYCNMLCLLLAGVRRLSANRMGSSGKQHATSPPLLLAGVKQLCANRMGSLGRQSPKRSFSSSLIGWPKAAVSTSRSSGIGKLPHNLSLSPIKRKMHKVMSAILFSETERQFTWPLPILEASGR